MGIKVKSQGPKVENLTAIQYDVLAGVVLSQAKMVESLAENAVPATDMSNEMENFDQAAGESLSTLEENCRALANFVADFRSRLAHRPKQIFEDVLDDDEEDEDEGRAKQAAPRQIEGGK